MAQAGTAKTVKVGIVGGTGYTGVELLRLLPRHPSVRLDAITSRSDKGLKVADLFPSPRGLTELVFGEPDVNTLAACESRFADEPFVDVMPPGSHPETRFVKGSNLCRIALHRPRDENVLVVLSVIDNLVKGASGQAVQCMNIMFGLDERAGINQPALLP